MWKVNFFFTAVLAVGLGQSAQAQQNCKCPQNAVCQCNSTVWTTPVGGVKTHHMPVPTETLLLGMTYALKPAAEKQAYLSTLSSQDQQFILANTEALLTSVQSMQADHKLYQQELQLKGTTTPQLNKLNVDPIKTVNKTRVN